jgi:hypothetical protein
MKKSRAYSLIRPQPCYRAEAFLAGLRAAGFDAHQGQPHWPGRLGEVLVIWNRYEETHAIASRFERDGGTVIVAENAYIGLDRDNRQRYAIALDYHNGRGRWFTGGPQRWQRLTVEENLTLAPLREPGREGYTLIAPNRSFGTPGGIMPHDWAERVARELTQRGERTRIRYHPGNFKSPVPLDRDLDRATRVVIWSSSVGVEALLRGIPVECRAPWWICKGWEQTGREHALQRLAWAQWSVNEIERGDPFVHLLACRDRAESGAPSGAHPEHDHLLLPAGETQITAGA